MSNMAWKMAAFLSVLWLCGGGCVQRTITVQSNPTGALVYLNDQEIGRTPVTRHFVWYGFYDVELRKTGYDSIKTTSPVIAPWWQWVPLDFATEMLPLTDRHEMQFTMHPPTPEEENPDLIAQRGEAFRNELQSSERATTQPAKVHHGKNKPTRP